MNISRLFIERPIMTTLVMFAILLFGIVGYRALPVAALPSVDYPTIQVGAALPGASPDTMASSVATVLERHFRVPQKALGGFPVSRGAQSRAFQGRLGLQAAALDEFFRLRLPVGRLALTSRGLFAKLPGLRGRAADTKPLGHQLEMAVDFGGVITLAHAPEMSLDHVRCARLALAAWRHGLAFATRLRTPSRSRHAGG